jgi:hypothetical protein
MIRLLYRAARSSLLLMLAVMPLASQARNTKLLLPISEVTNSSSFRQSAGNDIHFRFRAAPTSGVAADAKPAEDALAKAVATPVRGKRYDEEESDRRTCREAFRLALVDFANQARRKGGNAVVNIVSFYGGVEMASLSEYECHAGYTRSVVELKGNIQTNDGRATGSPVGVPVTDAGPVSRAVAPAMHSDAGDIIDVGRLPYANERMIAGYRAFLTKGYPRAFAVSPSGAWRSSWGEVKGDPAPPPERALRDCQKNSGSRCYLYAVDDTVVYKTPAADDPVYNPRLLPNANEGMVERYQYFLTRPLPRAFAISDDSQVWIVWGASSDSTDTAAQRAVSDCEKNYAKRCVLYAVDDALVYKAPVDQR